MSCSTDQMTFFHSNFMLQTSHADDHNSSLPPICTPQEFHAVASLLGKRSSSPMSFSNAFEEMNNQIGEDELSEDGEKKRRLNMEQVKTLEKTFEQCNKLEPERKIQLARALGLQPRQIAIWFQNKRARWKTKQLEKDYEVLKRQIDAVKGENQALKTHNQTLQAEILALKTREPTESINLNKETEGSCSNNNNNTTPSTDNSSELLIKLDNNINSASTPAIDSPLLISTSHPTTRPLFLQSSLIRPINELVPHHFFQNPSRPDIPGPKMDQTVKEESLTNVFIGMDDQTGFWPWLEQNHYN